VTAALDKVINNAVLSGNPETQKSEIEALVRTRILEIIGEQMVDISEGYVAFGQHKLPGVPEKPGLKLKVEKPLQLSKYEVTQELYELVTQSNPSKIRGLNIPVHNVSFPEAILFLNRLSKLLEFSPAYYFDEERKAWIWNQSSIGFRMPTETEWEYAARAGEAYFYAGSNDLTQVGQCDKLKQVGTKKPNAWGFFDMSCNAAELVWGKKQSRSDAYSLKKRVKNVSFIPSDIETPIKGRFLGVCKNCGSGAIYNVQFMPQFGGLELKSEMIGLRIAKAKAPVRRDKATRLDLTRKCQKSVECREHGQCVSTSEGSCVVSADWMCKQSEDCRSRGKCTFEKNRCVATQAQDCRDSKDCELACTCELNSSQKVCVARSKTCCENQAACSRQGLCSVDQSRSASICVAQNDVDCENSEICSKEGRCKAKNGVCVVTDTTCRLQPACLAEGLCFEINGKCQARDCRAEFTDVCSFYGRCTNENLRCVAIADVQCKKSTVCQLYGQCEKGDFGKCRVPKRGLPDGFVTPDIYCQHSLKIFTDEVMRQKKAPPTKFQRSKHVRECSLQIRARLSMKNRKLFQRLGRCTLQAATRGGVIACERGTPFERQALP